MWAAWCSLILMGCATLLHAIRCNHTPCTVLRSCQLRQTSGSALFLSGFAVQVETRRRMQAEYERKMAAIRAGTAQKQTDEAKRQQQRSAQLSRLQSATEVPKLSIQQLQEGTHCYLCPCIQAGGVIACVPERSAFAVHLSS